jgi:micrococcal nuclease
MPNLSPATKTARECAVFFTLRSLSCSLLFVFLVISQVIAADFIGPVVSVLDGDTLEVLHHQHPERIRLSGIDCPEKGQAYGKRAKQATSELVFGKDVTLQTHGLDKYGRTLADVFLSDGSNVTTRWSKTAGVGGIGNMRQGTQN